ncbi:MAG: CoA pyrophosphatase [Flavobacteriales bacterium]|nr:CoA pyrophosphatase [Flavobacteriales bacterium]
MTHWIERVKQQLSLPLPGEKAHEMAMTYQRPTALEARKSEKPPKESAVLMLLFPRMHQGLESMLEWFTVLILRQQYDGTHSGQVAFPGGKKEPGDASLEQTALRETQEEIGVMADQIEIIGKLTEIFIPPSNYTVQPYVGVLKSEPLFFPDTKEVDRVMVEPIDTIMLSHTVQVKPIFLPHYNVTVKSPYFDIQGHTVWGATAMMLMEFREMVKGSR